VSLFRSPPIPGVSWRLVLGGSAGVLIGGVAIGLIFLGLSRLLAAPEGQSPGIAKAFVSHVATVFLFSPFVTWVGLIPGALLSIPAARAGWAGPGTAVLAAGLFFGLAGGVTGGPETLYIWASSALPFALLFWLGAWIAEPRLRAAPV